MYPRREIYPRSPLALVAAELRYADAPRLRRQETIDSVAIALEDRLPVVESMQNANVEVDPTGSSKVGMERGTVLKDLAGTTVAAVFPNRFTFETTAYQEFPSFLDGVIEICRSLIGASVKPVLQRVGLRYIDEIRIPGNPVKDARQWAGWVDTRLVDHLSVGPTGAPVGLSQSLVAYDLGDRRGLNFRFAALRSGAVVVPTTIKRTPFEDGPVFVLDIDAYQDLGGSNAVRLEPDDVASALRSVHDAAGQTFQDAITDRARKLFRQGDE